MPFAVNRAIRDQLGHLSAYQLRLGWFACGASDVGCRQRARDFPLVMGDISNLAYGSEDVEEMFEDFSLDGFLN